MTIKELSEKRYSVRSFECKEIESDKLEYVLECARLAPSAVNFQPWNFYVVRSEGSKAKLHQCYSREWFNYAPLYIIACVEHDKEWVRKYDTKPHGDIDVAIAVEHICLAAAEQGLGTCWVCNFNAPLCSELFALPENEEPVVLIPIGYPKGEVAPKKRKAMEKIVGEL